MTTSTFIAAANLRSGAPDALAALCYSRGAAVLVYCQCVVGRDAAAEVAAEAFASLRVAILPPSSLTSTTEAERLLQNLTRRAALSHLISAPDLDHRPSHPGCAGRGNALLGYIERTLEPADRSVLAAHVGQCRSCAEILRRLQVAETAFKIRVGTKVPRSVARQILTALATAAPVGFYDGDAIAVRNEALLLLDGEDGTTATHPAPAPPGAESDPDDDPRLAAAEPPQRWSASRAPVAPETPPRPRPALVPQKPPAAEHDASLLARPSIGPSQTSMLLRSAARLAAVALAAGAGGTLLGVAVAALTGGDDSPSATPVAAGASTSAATADRLQVGVAATTVSPATIDAAGGVRVRVRVEVKNPSDHTVRPEPPRLLVDDIPVAPEPASAGSAPALLAPSLHAGATAKGTLRFELPSQSASALMSSEVRLRIAGNVVGLQPVLAERSATAG